jgi:hypothetical protein
MPRFVIETLALLTLLAGAGSAQPAADFSGRWILEAPQISSTPAVPGTPAVAAAAGDMGSGWGSTITITQNATQLRVEYAVFSRYDLQPPLTFTYPLDGGESRNAIMMGRGEQIESSRAQWNGQTLVIVTEMRIDDRGAGQPFTTGLTRKIWLESPTTMIVEVTRAGALGGPASTTRSVYRKDKI